MAAQPTMAAAAGADKSAATTATGTGGQTRRSPSRPACASTSLRPCCGCRTASPMPNGTLQVDVPIADSITTWRVTALASSQDGRLGSASGPLRVFQDFFVDLDLPPVPDGGRRDRRAGGRVQLPVQPDRPCAWS